MGAPSFSPYRSGVAYGDPLMLTRKGSHRTATEMLVGFPLKLTPIAYSGLIGIGGDRWEAV